MAKRAARPGVLSEGSFGAFVLDQLSGLNGVEARPMFGGAGFYLKGSFFGILYKQHLYLRVSDDTIGEYKKRRMKPFAPFAGRRGTSRHYYQVPLEILESPSDLIAWSRRAAGTRESARIPRKNTKKR
jgi:TfoX/Sxy family transcriptional regulator of competence genes